MSSNPLVSDPVFQILIPNLFSLQAKTFVMNSTTPILTSDNSRFSSNLNLKVQQSVRVMMGGRSFPLILTNPNHLQVSVVAALFFIMVGLFFLLLFGGQIIGL